MHGLLDAAVERYDAGLELATPEQLDAVDVESGQVTPKPRSACTRARPSWASFLVGRDDELVVAQGGALPSEVVEVEDTADFEGNQCGPLRPNPINVTMSSRYHIDC